VEDAAAEDKVVLIARGEISKVIHPKLYLDVEACRAELRCVDRIGCDVERIDAATTCREEDCICSRCPTARIEDPRAMRKRCSQPDDFATRCTFKIRVPPTQTRSN
jgi:hypothetical protein